MCGIAGFIGKAKHPKASFAFMTTLLEETEKRGIDATGFWAVESGLNGRITWYKAPVKSSLFTKKEQWMNLENMDVNLLISHCRQPTKVGDEKNNDNNHPHVSIDNALALVHNGKIGEYTSLKEEYETATSCDSEILLRILEYGTPDEKIKAVDKIKDNLHLQQRVAGICDIFSRVNYGAMAVAIGERLVDGRRHLWCFRDNDRPLHAITLIEELGQIFFFSTPDIFREAVLKCKEVQPYLRDQTGEIKNYDIHILTPYSVYFMEIGTNDEFTYKTFQISKLKDQFTYPVNKVKKKLKSLTKTVPLVVNDTTEKESEELLDVPPFETLDDETVTDEVPNEKIFTQDTKDYSNDDDIPTGQKSMCQNKISAIINDLKSTSVNIENMINEKSLTSSRFGEIVDVLTNIHQDVKSLESYQC